MATNQNMNEDAKEAQVSALTHALRTMRKHGFTIVQDKPGQAQSESEQFRRAQQLAADMLGVPVSNSDGLMNNLAVEILKVATAGNELGQFK